MRTKRTTNYTIFTKRNVRRISIMFVFFVNKKTLHNYAYRCIRTLKKYHQKSSEKSRKIILRGGNDPSSGRGVTFRPLKLLRNTLKVTPRHPQSYSRIGRKFTYPAALLFHSSSPKCRILTL